MSEANGDATGDVTRDELNVIWSLAHHGEPDFERARQIIDLAASLGVDGIELACGLEQCVVYTEIPELQGCVEPEPALDRRQVVQQIAHHAQQQGLRVGIWLREITGPPGFLEALPGLKADDGFLDIESDQLAELIEAKIDEFFFNVPEVDEVVLTLTQSPVTVFNRPFCDMPLAERVERVLRPVVEALQYVERGLALRVDCRSLEDGEALIRVAEQTHHQPFALVAPADFPEANPFSPDNPFLRKLDWADLRVEVDAVGEDYGCVEVPSCYPGYVVDRMRYAADHGADGFSLRAEAHGLAAPGTINEINLVAATAWAKDQHLDLERVWRLWLEGRLGVAPEGMVELLDQTFEVIKNALFIEGRPISRDRFPSFPDLKDAGVFLLLEDGPNLRRPAEREDLLTDTTEVRLNEVRRVKTDGVEIAEALRGWFLAIGQEVPDAWREGIERGLARLDLTARSCRALTRLMVAHLMEARGREAGGFESFAEEARVFLAIADEVGSAEGPVFFGSMTERMRGIVAGLEVERLYELDLRSRLDASEGVRDYVLCGLASEGHNLDRRLDVGEAFASEAISYRATGLGEGQGFSYLLDVPKDMDFGIEVTLVGSGRPQDGVLWLGPNRYELECEAANGERRTLDFEVPANSIASPARAEIHSTGPQPCQVSEIRVCGG